VTPIGFQLLEKKHALLDKPPFLALERCVKNIIIFISRYTRNFSLHLVKERVLIDPERLTGFLLWRQYWHHFWGSFFYGGISPSKIGLIAPY
jgi:hypothetical protein